MGGRGSSYGGSGGGEFKSTGDFNLRVDEMYKDQKKVDWEEDYIAGLPLRGYFGSPQSFGVNQMLRGELKNPNQRVVEANKNITKALTTSGLDIKSGTVVYRAVSGNFAQKVANMKIGSTYTEKGWLSTAGIKSNSARFGNVVMKIKVKGSKKALIYRKETEVLFKPGSKLKKISQSKSKGKTIINMELY